MGKAERIGCIATPYLLTIGALVCLIFVNLGSSDSGSSTLNNLYFLRADLSNLTLSTVNDSLSQQLIALAEQAISGNQTDELAAALEKADQDSDLKDFYDIGLWGYCSGNKTSQGDYQVTYCSPRETEFYFNPVTVWELNDTGLSNVLPTGLQDAINTYSKVSKWMFIAYVIALVSTAAELLIGLTAILSRLGSLVTSIVSAISTVFTIASAITATALFAALTGAINTGLKPYEIEASLGTHMLGVTWLAVAFSLASGLFWLLSSCCCSGRSPYHGAHRNNRSVIAEKAPYTYERVSSPYMRPQDTGYDSNQVEGYSSGPGPSPQIPLTSTHVGHQDAYEPYRHV